MNERSRILNIKTYACGPSNIAEFKLPRNGSGFVLAETTNSNSIALRCQIDTSDELTNDNGDWFYIRPRQIFELRDIYVDEETSVYVRASADTRISVITLMGV